MIVSNLVPRRLRSIISSDLIVYIGLALAILTAYLPVRNYGFVNFDDPDYVSANPHVRQGITADGVAWAFTSTEAANWFPLTRLSHMLDVAVFGLDAGWHHLVNVLLHTIATWLLFAFLHRTTGARWWSALVAFLFALHPLHVESVAWIAERKDNLSAVFWFLTLVVYAQYVRKPGWQRYLLTLACFALGLMAKPMLVTLPFVLLLMDVWPLGRPRTLSLLREKIPFFVLSGASSGVTYFTQAASGAVDTLRLPLLLRLENACVTYWMYIAKMFWPVRLAVFYPYPHAIPAWEATAAAMALLGISFLALRRLRAEPYLAAGWLWYLGTLVPVIGLVQVGGQARADRYTYIPMVGLWMSMAWALSSAIRRWPRSKPAVLALVVAACGGCLILTAGQVGYWRDSESLYEHALASTTDNDIAEHNLGTFLMDVPGRSNDAIQHLQAAIRIRPSSVKAHTDLGTALSKIPGREQDAIREYSAALELAPGLAVTHNNLGNTLSRMNRREEAITEYRAALRIDPVYAEAHNGLGAALAAEGHAAEAIAEFQQALRLRPDDAEAKRNLAAAQAPADQAALEYNRGLELAREGNQAAEAIAHFENALRLKPDYAEAHNNLGVVLSSIPGKSNESIRHFEQAIRIRPDYVEAHVNLGIALSQIPGRTQEAIREFEIAQRIRPDPEVQRILEQLRGK